MTPAAGTARGQTGDRSEVEPGGLVGLAARRDPRLLLLHLCELAGYSIQEVVVEWLNRDESETKGQKGELARYLAKWQGIKMRRGPGENITFEKAVSR